MTEPLERMAIISGAAQSDIGRRLYRSGLDLTIEAALRAIDDAGLTVDDRVLELDPPAVFVIGRR